MVFIIDSRVDFGPNTLGACNGKPNLVTLGPQEPWSGLKDSRFSSFKAKGHLSTR